MSWQETEPAAPLGMALLGILGIYKVNCFVDWNWLNWGTLLHKLQSGHRGKNQYWCSGTRETHQPCWMYKASAANMSEKQNKVFTNLINVRYFLLEKRLAYLITLTITWQAIFWLADFSFRLIKRACAQLKKSRKLDQVEEMRTNLQLPYAVIDTKLFTVERISIIDTRDAPILVQFLPQNLKISWLLLT